MLGLAVGATILWGRHTIPMPRLQEFDSLHAFMSYLTQAFDSGPAPYLLYPFRLMVRPYLAADGHAFLRALWPVLGMLGVHYWWVIRSNVAFEEASVELSRKIADRVAAVRAGRWQPGQKMKKAKRPPFELQPTGWPGLALLWKNLIAAGQFFSARLLLLLLWGVFMVSIVLGSLATESGLMPALSLLCLMLTGMCVLLGPQMVRQDFRQDLPMADILKMYPLRGWQVALGELLAPAVILTATQWCLLILTVGLCSRLPDAVVVPLSTRLALGLGAAVIFPMLNLISLLIPNLGVLIFPSWFQTGKDSPQGIEATGQRLIFMLGQLVVLVVALVPAALSFTMIFLTTKYVAGWVVAVPPASVAAAIVLAMEAALGLMLLGRLFDRLDLSAESMG